MSCALSGYICMWLQRVVYKTKLLCTLFFMYPKMGIFWNVTFFCCYLFIFFVKKQTSGMYAFLTYMFVKWVSCPSNYGWQEARNCETHFMNRFMSNFCIVWKQLFLILLTVNTFVLTCRDISFVFQVHIIEKNRRAICGADIPNISSVQ